ncbi:ABC transporter ATP-binding protein [Brachybacterium muris]|uniref:ABC transporter ATP-binding protein n=1 Tax=Brachybacterium muris TaxID=219301 RepID=UPI00223BB4FE|nr:ABC transporter ATP-binding protein [Brachybacterium muris]
MISFDDITVRYGDFTALPKLDLTIEEGEFFTLLGPSGCGKSTALRTLAGFVTPTSGRIRVAGKDVTRSTPDKRGVGMVFQNYALFPSMNVRENIAFGLATRRTPSAELRSRVDEIAAQVNLSPEQLDKNISELSGGQQQRVAIARALILRPSILLLDEPLSNLDAKLRQQLRIQLKDLQAQFGITTVYVTHDQDEALSMSDRIAVMNHGRIEQFGTPEELYDDSASEFVCTFLGDVNRLSPRQVQLLNDSGAGLDTTRRHYIRVEKVRVEGPGSTATHRGVPVTGTVRKRRYEGATSTFEIEVGDSLLRVIRIMNDDRGQGMWSPGDEVRLYIDPQKVLSYTPPVQEVAV